MTTLKWTWELHKTLPNRLELFTSNGHVFATITAWQRQSGETVYDVDGNAQDRKFEYLKAKERAEREALYWVKFFRRHHRILGRTRDVRIHP